MGKYYTAKFKDGTERIVADFSMGRAKLFYAITKVLEEQFLHQPSGISDDTGEDEHIVQAEVFIEFFTRFWQEGWLADTENSFVCGWAAWAAGMVENITLTPVVWMDRNGKELNLHRYILHDEAAEALLQQRKKEGPAQIRPSENNLTNLTITS